MITSKDIERFRKIAERTQAGDMVCLEKHQFLQLLEAAASMVESKEGEAKA